MLNLVRRGIARPFVATARQQREVEHRQEEQLRESLMSNNSSTSTSVLALCGNDEGLASLFDLHYQSNLEPFLSEHNLSLAELSSMPVVNRRILFLDSLRRAQRWKLLQMQHAAFVEAGAAAKRQQHDAAKKSAAVHAVEAKILQRGRAILLENLRTARRSSGGPTASSSPAVCGSLV